MNSGDKCRFFLWDTDAEAREKAQFGDNYTGFPKFAANEDPPAAPVDIAVVPAGPTVAPVRDTLPPSKQPVARVYPRLNPQDDGFDYHDTPTKGKAPISRLKSPAEETFPDWEDSDEEVVYKKHIGRNRAVSPIKRPRFDDRKPNFENRDSMAGIEFSQLSPLPSPVHKRPIGLGDPFQTPPKQVTSTPHTPPETRPVQTSSLNTLSYALLQKLSPHQSALGTTLFQQVQDHILRCGRVADGAMKGREAARTANRDNLVRIKDMESKVEYLERKVGLMEAEREVDKAYIATQQKNVDNLTGKTKRASTTG